MATVRAMRDMKADEPLLLPGHEGEEEEGEEEEGDGVGSEEEEDDGVGSEEGEEEEPEGTRPSKRARRA